MQGQNQRAKTGDCRTYKLQPASWLDVLDTHVMAISTYTIGVPFIAAYQIQPQDAHKTGLPLSVALVLTPQPDLLRVNAIKRAVTSAWHEQVGRTRIGSIGFAVISVHLTEDSPFKHTTGQFRTGPDF